MLLGFNIVLALHILAVALTALRVLSRDYVSPTKRISWILVLIMVPLFGVAFYFMFGELHLLNLQKKHDKLFGRIRELEPAILGDCANLDAAVEQPYRGAFQYAQSINGFGLTLGNTVDLMADGDAARARIIADIDAAKESINILYYIWLSDETGRNTAEALIRAAERGVICRVMADALGSRKFVASRLWKDMKKAGVQTSIAMPLRDFIKTAFTSRIDLRNHRKITIIDNQITYCGSQNCADEAFAVKKKYAPWIDIMFRIQGPVVAQNLLLFGSDWLIDNEGKLGDFAAHIKPIKGGVPAQVWGDGPVDRPDTTPQLLTSVINSAQQSLTISTPYFVPEETVLGALYSAAYRGLDVTIIFPNKNDSWIVRAASHSYYREMLEAGIKIFEYEGGLLHAKTITIDDHIAMIGSTNIDLRSFNLNFENNMILYGEDITKTVKDRQEVYKESSKRISLESVQKWTLPQRIWSNCIAAIGPVL